jgi:protein-disulfide isomerase
MRPMVEDLTPPVDLDRDHWRGGARAAVTLVEYGDYECPYSRMAFRTIQRLEAELDERLDLDGRTVWQRVQADADSALESGARGTPTLFVNGRLYRAGYDEAVLRAALHAAIKET